MISFETLKFRKIKKSNHSSHPTASPPQRKHDLDSCFLFAVLSTTNIVVLLCVYDAGSLLCAFVCFALGVDDDFFVSARRNPAQRNVARTKRRVSRHRWRYHVLQYAMVLRLGDALAKEID